jgi:hypothetical protein
MPGKQLSYKSKSHNKIIKRVRFEVKADVRVPARVASAR